MRYKTVGELMIISGDGDPTGSVDAPTGSIFIDYQNGNLYIKTDSSWEILNS